MNHRAGIATLLILTISLLPWVALRSSAQVPDSTSTPGTVPDQVAEVHPFDPSPTDTLYLDLNRAVDIALGRSPDAFRSEISTEQAWLSFKSARLDLYMPQLNAEASVPSFNQALVEQFVYDPVTGENVLRWVRTENRRWVGDLAVDQPLPTGGSLRLDAVVYRRFFGSDITEDETEYSASYRVSFSQELLRGNLRRFAKQRAELAWERARLNAVQTRRGLVFNVLESYYGLLASQRELAISGDDLGANRETAELARRKFEAGLIPEVEALQLEVEAARVETALLAAESSYEGQVDRLLATLGLPLDQPVRIVGQPDFQPVDVDADSALARALARRDEMKLSELSVEQAELSLVDAKRPWRIGGQVSAFYNLDRRTEEFDAAFSSDYDDYFVNRGFVFNLSLPLFSGGRRHIQVQTARLGLRQAEYDAEQTEKQVALEVRAAIRALRESRRRYEISLQSLSIAEQSWEISRQRFENGQITAREWIDAQISMNRTRISTARALMDHNVAVARYRLVVGDPVLPGIEVRPFDPDARGW